MYVNYWSAKKKEPEACPVGASNSIALSISPFVVLDGQHMLDFHMLTDPLNRL